MLPSSWRATCAQRPTGTRIPAAVVCDAIHYHTLQSTRIPFIDTIPAWLPTSLSTLHLKPLRDYQQEAKSAWLQNKRGMVVMPTGTGKTEVALSIIAELQCSVLIVCPLKALMYQWKERLQQAFDCKIGVIGDTHFHLQPLTVTTYKSACIHMPKLGNQFQCLIFDECHHLPGPVLGDSARMSAAPYRLGLTATPAESTDCESLIGPIIYMLPLDQVPTDSLAKHRVKRIPVELTKLNESNTHGSDKSSSSSSPINEKRSKLCLEGCVCRERHGACRPQSAESQASPHRH
ncbi:DEAD/DEAH box helicase family protein [Cerasicoccus maritimus]|uniref:DEAD/DEAH box helicase family protein n=1 Tax=Cerasicoccus maritimus TaxID=490089 RepID=UPI002852D274|nr:DEAD/DEAH box helicase family protein [Cerasicoccus maritimus]